MNFMTKLVKINMVLTRVDLVDIFEFGSMIGDCVKVQKECEQQVSVMHVKRQVKRRGHKVNMHNMNAET